MVHVHLRRQPIEEFLARRNLSQGWLALKLNISSGYLSQLLDGSRCPSPRTRERFLAVLGDFEFDDLFEIRRPPAEHTNRVPA